MYHSNILMLMKKSFMIFHLLQNQVKLLHL